MKIKVFVDTDVIFDLLAKREPFYTYAAQLFSSADSKALTVCISSISIANVNYILSKQKSASEARKLLSRFKVLVQVLPVDDKIIELALNGDFRDFEDAIQYYCAIENGVKIIVTRNLRDFKKSKLPVFTSEDFVKNYLS
jgi:predicted nucleic acid-binding protein